MYFRAFRDRSTEADPYSCRDRSSHGHQISHQILKMAPGTVFCPVWGLKRYAPVLNLLIVIEVTYLNLVCFSLVPVHLHPVFWFKNVPLTRHKFELPEQINLHGAAELPIRWTLGPRWVAVITWSNFKPEAIFGFLSPNYTGHVSWLFFVKPQNGLVWPF